ncbi:MAG: trypsin-like peptidase domain-containing protein [Bacilli bacterium]
MKNIKIVLIFILGIFISFSLMGCTDNNDNKLVVSITLNEDGEMIILYDDGTSDNLGDFSNDELISDFNDKLISQENKIKEQEEMLLAQESKIAEQETKIAEQETKIAEQEQTLILQRTLIDNINELIESNEVITNEIYNNIYNAIINIEDFENLVKTAIDIVAPSVLGITSYINVNDKLTPYSTGSGVVYKVLAINSDGEAMEDYMQAILDNTVDHFEYYLMTNRHVVSDNEKDIVSVEVYDGDLGVYYEAEVLGFDDKVDVAVVKFLTEKFMKPVEFMSEQVERGDFAIAIGNPNGYDYYGSATFGIVSHGKRYLSDDTDGDLINDWDAEYIQHDVAINPGNSGGALINLEGKLIGINTLKLVSDDIDNMGFAIPLSTIQKLLPLLEKGITPQRYKLGISIYMIKEIIDSKFNESFTDSSGNPITSLPEGINSGVYITEVGVDSISNGILFADDIIVSFNGEKIMYSYEFRAILGEMTKGDSAEFLVYRGNEFIEVIITFE